MAYTRKADLPLEYRMALECPPRTTHRKRSSPGPSTSSRAPTAPAGAAGSRSTSAERPKSRCAVAAWNSDSTRSPRTDLAGGHPQAARTRRIAACSDWVTVSRYRVLTATWAVIIRHRPMGERGSHSSAV